jgi:hypothetical protein
MSLEAVVGRVDQILAFQKALADPGVHQMDQSEVNRYLKSGRYQPFHPAGM